MSRLTKDSSLPGPSTSTSQEDLGSGASSASNRTLKVTLLSSEWRSTKGGLSTINRELAIQLAKHPNVEVCMYLPWCSEEDKRAAACHKVHLIEAEEMPGYDPVDWLATIPKDHVMDCVIGHGVHLGRQVPHIKRLHGNCKWVQLVHTDPEELGMFKSYVNPISKGEKKHQSEVKLCELADQVVAVGSKLAEAFAAYLRSNEKDQDVFNLTPGIFTEFKNVRQAAEERRTFRVLVFGRGDSEDFRLKGYDIAAKAIAELKDMPQDYKLVFVGAPVGEEEKVTKLLLKEGIARTQLTVRHFDESREHLAKLFCEVDLAIMPSRSEGFGLAALEALSAGLPVLVSGNSGFGEALRQVPFGAMCVVNSEDPKEWAQEIRKVCEKDRALRLKESKLICGEYAETYSWQGQCDRLVTRMLNITFGLLHLRLDCTCERTARAGVNVEAPGIPAATQQPQTVATPPASVHAQAVDINVHETEDIHTTQQVMNLIAVKCFKTVDPSKEEETNKFVHYIERVRRALIVGHHEGSLIITLQCSSLQILEQLWEDYCTGHLNKMAQQFLVTEDILEFFGLAEVKLTATIFEEEYRACREYLLRLSGATSNQENVLVIERHMAIPASEEGPSHSLGLLAASDSLAMETDDDSSDSLENHDSFIVSQITEQFEQLRRLREDLQNAFVRWIPIRRRTREQLEELATKLHEHHRNVNITTITGASMGTVGGILSVAGLIAAPFTFGAGIVVSLVGAGIGGAGGLVMSGSKVVEMILEKLGLKEVQTAIEEDHKASRNLTLLLDSMENFISQLTQFLKPLHDDARLIRELEGSGFDFLRDRIFFEDIGSSTEEKVDFGARFFRAATSAATISASAAATVGVVARSAALAGTRAAHIAGSVIGAALLPLDITLLVKSSLELHRGSTSTAVEDIRKILSDLECPEEDEVEGLVESFIDEKFTEAYNKTENNTTGENQTDDDDDDDDSIDSQRENENK